MGAASILVNGKTVVATACRKVGYHQNWKPPGLRLSRQGKSLPRERDVTQREVAVHRAEARSQASARQLAELRRRLDDYGEELEEGVAALTSQQNALREERRQTLELQARARRMCAAAIRDDVVAIV